jgi:hypothetical protein
VGYYLTRLRRWATGRILFWTVGGRAPAPGLLGSGSFPVGPLGRTPLPNAVWDVGIESFQILDNFDLNAICHTIACMPAWNVPDELADMLRKRRVIPFIGAGFSSILGLPDWNTLLSRVAEEVQAPLTFEKVYEDCQGDPLQIAEYYFLISDRSIGPLRFAIGKALVTTKSPILSGAHVELVNLGMPQIYTTNFDDLIEQAFHDLKQTVQSVVLPKHIASAGITSTQVVKYHGDLRHDKTLVLTESSYYERLDFESPMDLKFRSDLLGRSVLFMGYSFKDINIRVIWFKLMDMMKDIPVNERPTSFILRLNSNPALERLYEEVGIKTIVLDPNNKAITPEQKAALLNDFMFTLATLASRNCKIPGQEAKQQFFSAALSDLLIAELDDIESGKASRVSRLSRHRRVPLSLVEMLEIAGRRAIPNELQEKARLILDKCVILSQKENQRMLQDYLSMAVPIAVTYSKTFGVDPLATFIISMGLGRSGTRETLLGDSVPWNSIWAAKLTTDQADRLLKQFESEINFHTDAHNPGLDHDLAYISDSVKRILSGEIFEAGESAITRNADSLIKQAAAIYPSVLSYAPSPGAPPKPEQIVHEIDEREAVNNPPDDFLPEE